MHPLLIHLLVLISFVCQLWATRPVAAADISLPPVMELPAAESRDWHTTPPATGRALPTTLTYWLPPGADELFLPISGGAALSTANPAHMALLRAGAPWAMIELPLLGARYGNDLLVIIAPTPHYCDLVVNDRVGLRFEFPAGVVPQDCHIVTIRHAVPADANPLETATVFRQWRASTADTGSIPKPRPLTAKINSNPATDRLLGAPHIYLWGPSLFSKHDISRSQWIAFAKMLNTAPPESFAAKLRSCFGEAQLKELHELATSDWPADHLTTAVASTINSALTSRELLALSANTPAAQVIEQNQVSVAAAFGKYITAPPADWGDGFSATLLKAVHDSGIDRAVLVLSDLRASEMKPSTAAKATALGYLIGPYDSYHSVHNPQAPPDGTWETAQFDSAAFENGRILNSDGTGHAGFRGRGYHFSPQAAWPYVQTRVNGIISQTRYSTWFVDCDATGECFDDFHPDHPAIRIDDILARRQRLAWLDGQHRLVVGSEGGSVLFADIISYGHGVQTPYIGHLDPSFRDAKSPSFLGRHWPPDRPDMYFKPIRVPDRLRSPYFDPTVRIPLYQAAIGDEVIATHHWNFDSLKFSDVRSTRELLEILYMVPPMYHLSREAWPARSKHVVAHHRYWSPLHRQLATAPLIRLEYLSNDHMLQRTTFQTTAGRATITVNFSDRQIDVYGPYSATAAGSVSAAQLTYHATEDKPPNRQ